MSEINESLSIRLSELRKSKGISQKEIADSIGISYRTIQNYEYGKREPNLDQLVALAKFFNVSLDYLVGMSDFNTEVASLHWITVKEVLKKVPRGYLYGIHDPNKRVEILRNTLKSFTKTLSSLRTKNDWSVENLSKLTSIPKSVLTQLEDENLQFMPKRRHLEKLASTFQVECDTMFGIKNYKKTTLSEYLVKGMRLSNINSLQLSKLVNIKYKDFLDILNETYIVTDSLLLLRLSYALPLTVPDTFNSAGYSYFDYDCFDLETGVRIDPPSNEVEVANLLARDPEALQLFDEYSYASNEDKHLLLEMWRKINKTDY